MSTTFRGHRAVVSAAASLVGRLVGFRMFDANELVDAFEASDLVEVRRDIDRLFQHVSGVKVERPSGPGRGGDGVG